MKEKQGTEGAYSSEPQKAHLTSEFTIVPYNFSHSLLCLVSRFKILVSHYIGLVTH